MCEIFGDFIEKIDCRDYLEINFLPTTLSIKERWHNNDLSANFLADYWSCFFPAKDESSKQKQTELKDSINYISNELLENAMKFNHEASEHPIHIGLYLYGSNMRFYATNSVDPENFIQFKDYIQKLITNDPYDMYIRQLETESEESHLGFLTMLNDYEVRLAWKFNKIKNDKEIIIVTIMAELTVL